MRIDVREYPVFDNHCHPYWPKKNPPPFYEGWNSSLFPIEDKHLKNGMTYIMVNNMLRYHMQIPESATRDEVLAERDRRITQNPRDWGQELLKDANITGMMIDISYPITAWLTGKYMTDENLAWFEDMAKDIEIKRVIRFEFAYNKLLPEYLPFDSFEKRFFEEIDMQIKKYRPFSFKSVIGYFTGLDVARVDRVDAALAYEKYQMDISDYRSEKVLRDYMLWQGTELCLLYDLPLQIHTGMGNTPMCHLTRMNPCLLHDFFCDKEHQKVKTVILHAGYPYMREAGYMAGHFPQVSVDISQMIPHAGRASETGLYELMEVAPFSKIHYASDGGALPEHTWYTAKYFKNVLSDVLTNFTDNGIFSRTEAYDIARSILLENTRDFYRLR